MGKNPSRFQAPLLPVDWVSWHDAQDFCRELSARDRATYRLPTEAEWEYACRANTSTEYCFGDSPRRLSAHGQFQYLNELIGSRFKVPRWLLAMVSGTLAVGSKVPNPWGLHDVYGNVFEWCFDRYGPYQSAPQVDPSGPEETEERVARGGSWLSPAVSCRSAARAHFAPDERRNDLGFRVVRDAV